MNLILINVFLSLVFFLLMMFQLCDSLVFILTLILIFNFILKQLSPNCLKPYIFSDQPRIFLQKKSLKAIYYSIFHCYLVYCVPIWSCTSQKSINNLFVMQKKAVRLIIGSRYNAHSEPIFRELGILPLNKIIDFFNLQFMQNFVQGFLPISFNNVWVTNEERRPDNSHHILRNSCCCFRCGARAQ